MHKFLVFLVGDRASPVNGWRAVEARDAHKAAELMAGEALSEAGPVEHLRALVRQRGRRQGPALFYDGGSMMAAPELGEWVGS